VTNESMAPEKSTEAVQEAAAGHDLIVVGASSGGVEALKVLVGGLPADLPAAVLVVVHVAPDSPRLLAGILDRAGALPCQYAQDQEGIRKGHIYVAPPNYHLLVEPARLRVVRGPKENRARPAVDPLFRTAAAAYGPRTIGVILSGNLNDGTAGLSMVKRAGGIAIVQDPTEALYPSMPQGALEAVEVDYVVPLGEMASVLSQVVNQPVPPETTTVLPHGQEETTMVRDADREPLRAERLGPPSAFACPDCDGVLYEIEDARLWRFRCRVGHAFTAEVLRAEKAEVLEQALWIALRTLEEKVDLQRQMAYRAAQRGLALTASEWQEEVHHMEQQVELLRQLLYPAKG
jgi:two-component system, chemotaxis family, protein-glutamate methylesterase/glutaminase